MTLREHIAKALMHSRIGMTRKELGDAIETSIYNGDLNRISDQLFHLQKAMHVEKSGGFNNSANRWAITSKGRAFYSDLNDDETDQQQTTSDLSSDTGMDSQKQDHAMDNVQAVEAHQKPSEIQNAENEQLATQTDGSPVTYDPFKDIYHQLQQAQDMLKRIPTAPRIQHKQEKLATLRLVQQSIGLFNGDVEDILQQIYQDLDQMEAA